MHSLKIEDLNMSKEKADQIVEVLNDFLLDLGYSKHRIESIESRRRDGFIPYSHNKGGLEAVSFVSQQMAEMERTGFKNTDEILDKYYQNDLNEYLKDNGLTELEKSHYESFDEYRSNSDDTVMFSTQLVLNDDNTLNVLIDVCAKDSPYHRKYDDRLDIKINFKTIKSLKSQLNKLLKNDFIETFMSNLSEAW